MTNMNFSIVTRFATITSIRTWAPTEEKNLMKTASVLRFMPGFAAILALATVAYAGWGDIFTVKDFPDFAVAGKPLNLAFKEWVPSEEPLQSLHPSLHATNTIGLVAKAVVKPGATTEDFTAELILPEPGDWVITINSGVDSSSLPPLKVIAAGTPPPPPLSLATRGLRLFTAKGCYSCHLREGVGRHYGPDLTGKRFAPEYLRKFLADPSITPVPDEVCNKDFSICGSPYAMPNLHLKKAEIEALVAFINEK